MLKILKFSGFFFNYFYFSKNDLKKLSKKIKKNNN